MDYITNIQIVSVWSSCQISDVALKNYKQCRNNLKICSHLQHYTLTVMIYACTLVIIIASYCLASQNLITRNSKCTSCTSACTRYKYLHKIYVMNYKLFSFRTHKVCNSEIQLNSINTEVKHLKLTNTFFKHVVFKCRVVSGMLQTQCGWSGLSTSDSTSVPQQHAVCTCMYVTAVPSSQLLAYGLYKDSKWTFLVTWKLKHLHASVLPTFGIVNEYISISCKWY